MTDDQIRDEVIAVLRTHCPEAGFEDAEVYSDIDYDGESIIQVNARYARRPNVRPDPLVSAVHAIRDRLISLGEERFVFLSNDVETERLSAPEETA